MTKKNTKQNLMSGWYSEIKKRFRQWLAKKVLHELGPGSCTHKWDSVCTSLEHTKDEGRRGYIAHSTHRCEICGEWKKTDTDYSRPKNDHDRSIEKLLKSLRETK